MKDDQPKTTLLITKVSTRQVIKTTIIVCATVWTMKFIGEEVSCQITRQRARMIAEGVDNWQEATAEKGGEKDEGKGEGDKRQGKGVRH